MCKNIKLPCFFGLHDYIVKYMKHWNNNLYIGPCYIVNNILVDSQLYVSGGIKNSETAMDAIRREIREEIDDKMGLNAHIKLLTSKKVKEKYFLYLLHTYKNDIYKKKLMNKMEPNPQLKNIINNICKNNDTRLVISSLNHIKILLKKPKTELYPINQKK